MTDYLEELLDVQEQEDVQQTAEWKKPRIFARGLSSPADSGGFAAGASPTPETTLSRGQVGQFKREETAVPARAEQAVRGDSGTTYTAPEAADMPLSVQTGGSHSAVWSLEWELKRLHRAVRPWEGQRTVRMEQGTAAGVPGNSFSFGPAPGPGRAAGYAALVDTAFARDARRYDGPLRLL